MSFTRGTINLNLKLMIIVSKKYVNENHKDEHIYDHILEMSTGITLNRHYKITPETFRIYD